MRRVLLVLSVAALMAAMISVSALPALAVNTGDANQGPPLLSGSPDQSTVVIHCGGMSQYEEGARISHNGSTGPFSGECQTPPRNENGSPIGHL